MTKPIPARKVKPGMHIRRPEAVSTSPYAAFREVARTHNVGIYRQIDIEFTDGTGDTWTLDAEFEVQSDAERATDVAVAAVYARLADAYRVPPAAEPPAPTRPSYDPNPTIMLAPGQTYADWYERHAAMLDDRCPGWHLDDLDRMAGELADEAQQRREAGEQR